MYKVLGCTSKGQCELKVSTEKESLSCLLFLGIGKKLLVFVLFGRTDWVAGLTHNVVAQKCIFCAKSAMKIIAPPIESEHSFLTGNFLNNYDVRDGKTKRLLTTKFDCRKMRKMRGK